MWNFSTRQAPHRSSALTYYTTVHLLEPTKTRQTSPAQQLLRLLLEIAALFHDVGKANQLFQGRLRGAKKLNEAVKHELLSAFILDAWIQSLSSKSCWLQVLEEQPFRLRECLDDSGTFLVPKKAQDFLRTSGTSADAIELEYTAYLLDSTTGADPLRGAVLWLVLTHHKLVGAVKEEGIGAFSTPSMLGVQLKKVPLDAANLKAVTSSLPWCDEQWCGLVSASARDLRVLLAENPSLLGGLTQDPVLWGHTLASVCRPYLIYSDYIGSIKKKEATPLEVRASKHHAYANTLKVGGKQVLADTLPLHLKKVHQAVKPLFSVFEDSSLTALPAINVTSLSGWSQLRNAPLKHREYGWQQLMVDAVNAQHCLGAATGFFVLMSETGSGKTIASVKLLAAAASGALRFTTALGLRSLTLQTGSAYTDPDGLALPKSSVLTVVGSALYSNLSSEAQTEETTGSECMEERELMLSGGADGNSLKGVLTLTAPELDLLLSSKKNVAMTSSPVLVCTVDHLMSAAAPANGGDTRMLLRLASADLILDEVDNYTAEDLVSLGRLVHLAGVHGRRVVLMSATVSETVALSLYEAWRAGLAVYDLRQVAKSSHLFAMIADKVPPVVERDLSISGAVSIYQEFVGNVIDSTPSCQQKNVGGILALTTGTPGAFKEIFQKVLSLKESFNEVDATGRRISTCAIRFNQVKSARAMAAFVHQVPVPDGVSVRVVCYHRRIPLLHLSAIERALNAINNRKQPSAIFTHPLIREWIAAEPDAQHYVLIVSTTSIQETGRDHDYDFCIAEPWSTRSLTQIAGRVYRHRKGRSSLARVWLLDKPLTDPAVELLAGGVRAPFAKIFENKTLISARIRAALGRLPARGRGTHIEGELVAVFKSLGVYEAPETLPADFDITSSAGLDTKGVQEGISAHNSLRAPPLSVAPLTSLEHAAMHQRMKAAQGWSLRNILVKPRAALFASHHRSVIFRRRQAKQALLTFSPASHWNQMCLVTEGSYGSYLTPVLFELEPLLNLERALVRVDLLCPESDAAVPEDVRANIDSNSAKLLLSFEAYTDVARIAMKKPLVAYHPLLGAGGIQDQTRNVP